MRVVAASVAAVVVVAAAAVPAMAHRLMVALHPLNPVLGNPTPGPMEANVRSNNPAPTSHDRISSGLLKAEISVERCRPVL